MVVTAEGLAEIAADRIARRVAEETYWTMKLLQAIERVEGSRDKLIPAEEVIDALNGKE